MNLIAWSKRHNVSAQALAELLEVFGLDQTAKSGISESVVQTNIRIEASKIGVSCFFLALRHRLYFIWVEVPLVLLTRTFSRGFKLPNYFVAKLTFVLLFKCHH